MKLLIIGGTGFLGTHVTLSALRGGHAVTLLHRGQHPKSAPAAAAGEILGDRLDQALLDRVGSEKWEAVIDTNCYFPRAAAMAVSALAGADARYLLISTVSVYADDSPPYAAETWPLATIADENAEEVNGETYGALKALSEAEVMSRLPGRATIVRPGLIVGPGDGTDRFTYWCRRIGSGGDVLVPGPPGAPVQYIDVRDLADWVVYLAEAARTGVFNATGPTAALTMAGLIEGIAAAVQVRPRLHWIDPEFLLSQGVEPWSDLPLWAPGRIGHMTFSNVNAIQAGLRMRPLADTVHDALEWSMNRPMPGQAGPPGLAAEREEELLRRWSRGDAPVQPPPPLR